MRKTMLPALIFVGAVSVKAGTHKSVTHNLAKVKTNFESPYADEPMADEPSMEYPDVSDIPEVVEDDYPVAVEEPAEEEPIDYPAEEEPAPEEEPIDYPAEEEPAPEEDPIDYPAEEEPAPEEDPIDYPAEEEPAPEEEPVEEYPSAGSGVNDGETPDELTTWSYHFEEITEFEMQEITEFWQNRTNGENCVSLFEQIKENFALLQNVVYDIEGLIEQYNTDCSDKCLPGYVKCLDSTENKCILECDCCALHSNDVGEALTCCSTSNHPVNTKNYAAGEGEELFCYDWCCEEDEVQCGGCKPIGSDLGVGVSLPLDYLDYQDGGYEGGVGAPQGGIVCCSGSNCCPPNMIWPLWIQDHIAFCCTPDEVVENNGQNKLCCCETEEEVCCPDHPTQHCQPASNNLCCDFDTQIECNGECWPKDKPCCDIAKGFSNCAFDNDVCKNYCCCDTDAGESCCELRKECLPEGEICCAFDEQVCNGECIPKDDVCCPVGQIYCEFTYACEKHCCDTLNGFSWCEHYEDCSTHCCGPATPYCPQTGECTIEGQCCEVEGESWCQYTESCAEHCCQYTTGHHYVWCELHEACRDECDCCEDGFSACLCNSGEYNADLTCYAEDGEECCKEFWCEKCNSCVDDEFECCECDGDVYLGSVVDYDSSKCCPSGSNMFTDGEFGVGCCKYTSQNEHNCCVEADRVSFNELNDKCEQGPELEPCPCEGCCDFNCCDELDFFMHKAFYQHYNSEYDDFEAFYDAWYLEFYAWWTNPMTE